MSEEIRRILNHVGRPKGVECKEARRSVMSRGLDLTFVLRPPMLINLTLSENALEDVQSAHAVDLLVDTMTRAKGHLETAMLIDLVGSMGSAAVFNAVKCHADVNDDAYSVFTMCEWLGMQFMELAKQYETKVRR